MNKKFKVEVGKNEYTYDYYQVSNLLFEKVAPSFMQAIDRLMVNEDLYHHDTKIKVKRIA